MRAPRRHRYHIAGHGDRIASVDGSSVPQLAIPVVAHRPQRAVALQIQGMPFSRRHRHHIAGHGFRPIRVGDSPVAQLARAVIAHRPQGAVALQIQGMRGTCRHRHHIAGHGDRMAPGGPGPVAQLAKIVYPHPPQRAVALQIQGMVSTRCHRHHITGHGNRIAPAGRGPVAQLAVVVPTHRPQAPVTLQIQGMPGAHRRDHHIARHGFRSAPTVRGPVPQLPIVVGTPNQQLRRAHRHRDWLADDQTTGIGHHHTINTRVRHARADHAQVAIGCPQYHSSILEPLVRQRPGTCGRNAQEYCSAHGHGLVGGLRRNGKRAAAHTELHAVKISLPNGNVVGKRKISTAIGHPRDGQVVLPRDEIRREG